MHASVMLVSKGHTYDYLSYSLLPFKLNNLYLHQVTVTHVGRQCPQANRKLTITGYFRLFSCPMFTG